MSIEAISPIASVLPEHTAPDGSGRQPTPPPGRKQDHPRHGDHHHRQEPGYAPQPPPSAEDDDAPGLDSLV